MSWEAEHTHVSGELSDDEARRLDAYYRRTLEGRMDAAREATYEIFYPIIEAVAYWVVRGVAWVANKLAK